MIKLKLLILAVLGSIVTYQIVNLLIVEISFARFFTIEILISISHEIYNRTKAKINNINPA